MLRRPRQESSVVDSWGMTIAGRRAAILHLLKPNCIAEQERALEWHKISGFRETVSRSINTAFAGTVAVGFYGGDRTTASAHGHFELVQPAYGTTLSRLAIAGTYNGEVIAYDDFTDNPTIAGSVPPVTHTQRMLVGRAMEDIVSQLRAEQSRGWSVLREAAV